MSTTTSSPVLVGVDVVKAEARIGLERAGALPGACGRRAWKRVPQLGLPAVVLDVGAAAERERRRVDDERELGEHEPALGEAERVHVGGLAHRPGGDHLVASPLPGRAGRSGSSVRGPELGRVVQHPLGRPVHVRVGGRQLARRVVGDAGRALACRRRTATGIGVSVIAMKRSPSFTRFTLALSVSFGENIALTRWNSERQGSVANSEYGDPPRLLRARAIRRLSRNRFA